MLLLKEGTTKELKPSFLTSLILLAGENLLLLPPGAKSALLR
jgi:hypothetical protein